jgi:hypothetical protein
VVFKNHRKPLAALDFWTQTTKFLLAIRRSSGQPSQAFCCPFSFPGTVLPMMSNDTMKFSATALLRSTCKEAQKKSGNF